MKLHEWHKASASNGNGGNCVEVLMTESSVLVRDTKDGGTGPVHHFTYGEWGAFVDGVVKGEFNLPAGAED